MFIFNLRKGGKMKKFNIGDSIWVVNCGQSLIKKICPICFGELKVTLILGDKSEVVLPCEYCGKGYEGPLGYVEEWEYTQGAERKIITGIEIQQEREGETREYKVHISSGSSWIYSEAQAFETEAEALEVSKATALKALEDQTTRAEHIKKHENRNYSWNAGYHIREAKRGRESAERHDKMAIICKARSREEKA